MIFSGRHYAALFRVYAKQFGEPVPDDVASRAAQQGQAPQLMNALAAAVEAGAPIKDWTPWDHRSS